MSKRAEEAAVRIHNTALRKAEKYASEHGMGVLGEVSYGWGFKAGAITGYEQAEKDLGWISVKDRLPEKNGWYFTCVEQFKIPQCVGITYFDKEDGWWLNDIPMTGRIFVSTIEIVDYWMPIPELPKEE